MAYVKLDTGILDSTLWVDRESRDVFLTALLMAVPFELEEDTPTIAIRTLDADPFVVPPGWYGKVEAAGSGIARRALVEPEDGLAALELLSSPDLESRSHAWGGRRMVRVDGGYIILNYMDYRDRDLTNAERQQRYRERQKARKAVTRDSNPVTVTNNVVVSSKDECKAVPPFLTKRSKGDPPDGFIKNPNGAGLIKAAP